MNNCSKISIIVSITLAISLVIVGLKEEISIWSSQLNIIYMIKLVCNPLFWIIIFGIVLLFLLITTIRLLHQYNKHIKILYKRIEAFPSTSKLEIEVHSIKTFVEIIAYIAIVFCLGIAIHYMAVELPRVLNANYQNSHIQNLGIDYLGLIVAIFAVIVTLLVGWQIYATIKAKVEVERIGDSVNNKISKDYGKRLTELEEHNIDITKTLNDFCQKHKNNSILYEARFRFLMAQILINDRGEWTKEINDSSNTIKSVFNSIELYIDALKNYKLIINNESLYDIQACIIAIDTDIKILIKQTKSSKTIFTLIQNWVKEHYKKYSEFNNKLESKIYDSNIGMELIRIFDEYQKNFERLVKIINGDFPPSYN